MRTTMTGATDRWQLSENTVAEWQAPKGRGSTSSWGASIAARDRGSTVEVPQVEVVKESISAAVIRVIGAETVEQLGFYGSPALRRGSAAADDRAIV